MAAQPAKPLKPGRWASEVLIIFLSYLAVDVFGRGRRFHRWAESRGAAIVIVPPFASEVDLWEPRISYRCLVRSIQIIIVPPLAGQG